MDLKTATLLMRVGLGLVMFSGGASTLGKLLDSNTQAAMLMSYTGPAG